MTLVVDAGPLVALADRHEPLRGRIREILQSERGRLVIPAPVTAEIDYLLGRRAGESARRAFLSDLSAGLFAVECLEPEEYASVASLERAYEALRPGLADLSLVVIAHRVRTRRLLTFDERHFRAIRPLQGGEFTILPADG